MIRYLILTLLFTLAQSRTVTLPAVDRMVRVFNQTELFQYDYKFIYDAKFEYGDFIKYDDRVYRASIHHLQMRFTAHVGYQHTIQFLNFFRVTLTHDLTLVRWGFGFKVFISEFFEYFCMQLFNERKVLALETTSKPEMKTCRNSFLDGPNLRVNSLKCQYEKQPNSTSPLGILSYSVTENIDDVQGSLCFI